MLAFVLCPFICVVSLSLVFQLWTGIQHDYPILGSYVLGTIVYALLYAAPVVYVSWLLFILAASFAARRGWAQRHSVLLVGLAVVVLSGAGFLGFQISSRYSASAFVCSLLGGVAAGLAFWLITKERIHHPLERTGASARRSP